MAMHAVGINASAGAHKVHFAEVRSRRGTKIHSL
jgi:hypothetical protein